MQFSLSEEQLMLKGLVERFVAERYANGSRAKYRATEDGFSRTNWSQMAELGLLAAPFSPEQGGLAGSLVEILVLMEALGRGYVVEPVLEQLVTPGRFLAHAGATVPPYPWLAKIINGESRLALAHLEQSAGQDLAQVSTVVRDGALHGDKAYVLAGGSADAYIVSARTPNSVGTPGIKFYLVERSAPGLEVRPFTIADGSVAAGLKLNGARGTEIGGADFDVLLRCIDETRIAACAEMLGVMSSLFDATLDYVRTRKQFGVPLSSFQVIQHRLADLYVVLEQSRSQVYRAALRCGDGRPDPADVAAMKSYVSAAAIDMGEQCIHLHGGMGITDELIIGHGHKRLLVLATMFGDADHELERYAKLVA